MVTKNQRKAKIKETALRIIEEAGSNGITSMDLRNQVYMELGSWYEAPVGTLGQYLRPEVKQGIIVRKRISIGSDTRSVYWWSASLNT